MLRSEKNQELIDEIEAGIKKEVSVGCSVKRRVCSICGQDSAGGNCGHRPGEVYDGTLCYVTLEQPADAYEWSFVAVPAQREAGVIRKGCGGSLKTFLKREGEQGWLRQLEQLEKEAAMGRSYIQQLRKDLVRLAGLAHSDLDCAIFAKTVGRMEEQELLELKRVYEEQLNRGHIPGVQLRSVSGPAGEDGDAFLV